MVWFLAGLAAIAGMGLALRARRQLDPEPPMKNEREPHRHGVRAFLRDRLHGHSTPTEVALAPAVVVTSLGAEGAAKDLASEYAKYFDASGMAMPLQAFLEHLSEKPLPGLHGVALAKWDAPSEQAYLAVYALVDDPTREASLPEATMTAVLQAHTKLNDQLWREDADVPCGLWFVQTHGQDLATFGDTLPTLLNSPSDPLSAARPESERIVHMHVAKAA